MIEKCKLCYEFKELRNSHAIPNSFFSTLLKKNSGKAILLTLDDQDISYSSDSLSTPQLCDGCEKKLNNQYEVYSINLLRNTYKNSNRTNEGIHFAKVDVDKFMKFILAVFWRAAVSKHDSYSGAVMNIDLLHNDGANQLRACLLNNSKIPESLFSIKISRLSDSTGGVDLNALKNIIVAPYPIPYGNGVKTSVNFVIEGFYISVIMPALSDEERRNDLVLYPKGSQFLAKYIDCYSIPKFEEVAFKTYMKMQHGRSEVGS